MKRDKIKRTLRVKKVKEMATCLEMDDVIINQLLSIVKRKKFLKYERFILLLCDEKTASNCSNMVSKVVRREQKPRLVLLAISLLAASHTRTLYQEADIQDNVFLDTMKCFTRFIKETYVKTGELTFDRFFWTWRQLSMQLYRLGTLEFEVIGIPQKVQSHCSKNQTHILSVHIPSDAILTNAQIEDSLNQAKEFFKNQYAFYCQTWLLSPTLNELLPSDSGINCFYKKFQIIGTEEGNHSCYEWLFKSPINTPMELLPEDTSLCRKAKKLLMEGGNIGTGYGIIVLS